MATVTKSIGTSSRDHSTITLWEANLDDDPTYDSGDLAVGEMYDDSAFDETVTIDSGDTIGLAKVTLTVASGERHDGTAGVGARVVRTSYARILQYNAKMSGEISWLEIDNNDEAGGGSDIDGIFAGDNTPLSGSETLDILRTIIHSQKGNFSHIGIRLSQITGSSSVTVNLLDNIVYDIHKSFGSGGDDAYGIYDNVSLPTVNIANHTSFDISGFGSGEAVGVKIISGGGTLQNTISMDTGHGSAGTTNDFDTAGTHTEDHNLSSDATAAGTGSLTSKSSSNQFVSTTGGSEDLHLKTGADAIDAATDLGTTPTGVEIDIDGRDRDAEGDTWDIGADEFVVAGGFKPPSGLALLGVGV